MAHAVDFIVDGGVLFDEGIGRGDVGLGLIVIVIGYEIAHGVLREELAELCRQLGGEGFVVGDDQRRAAGIFDDVGHGEGFTRAGNAQQHLMAQAVVDALRERLDGLRLIALRLIVAVKIVHGRNLPILLIRELYHIINALPHVSRISKEKTGCDGCQQPVREYGFTLRDV